MFPLSGCSSGFAYPVVSVSVFAFASVMVSVVLDGVRVALEEEPVITFVPLNATYPPVLELVP